MWAAITLAVLTVGPSRKYCEPGQLRSAAIAGAAALAAAALAVSVLRRSYGWTRAGDLAGVWASIAIVAFGEELLFRGLSLRLVASWWGIGSAIVVTSLLFGAGHWTRSRPRDGLVHVFTGLVFGVVAWLSGGWLASAAVHLVYNFVAFDWRPAKYVNQAAARMIAPQALP
jgi:membrane protease YdiL (CAAX protease family)